MIKKVLEKEIEKKLPKVIQQRTRAIDGLVNRIHFKVKFFDQIVTQELQN